MAQLDVAHLNRTFMQLAIKLILLKYFPSSSPPCRQNDITGSHNHTNVIMTTQILFL